MARTIPPPGTPETVFTYSAPPLVYGRGAIADAVHAVSDAARVLIVTDAGVAATGAPDAVAEQLRARGCHAEVFTGAHIEPTDESIRQALATVAAAGPWDALVAVGGGSSIDTAKALNLLSTNPGELLDYVNRPVGAGRAPRNRLLPLIAVPTSTGTGSESTSVCVLDVVGLKVKSGISHAWLRPSMAVVDPDLTVSQPAMVTASAGMDILCHALESYTARPFDMFPAKRPQDRVPYCGSNPVSDVWAETALRLMAGSFRKAVSDGTDLEARGQMSLAATVAGLGFGNAGVHLPHANAYPIAGRVRQYRPPDYPAPEPLIPHGMAVALTAPACLRLTFPACPDRHLAAARLLDPGCEGGADADLLPGVLRRIMTEVGMPSGLAAVGYSTEDIPDLVRGSLLQERLLALAPLEVTPEDLAGIFRESM